MLFRCLFLDYQNFIYLFNDNQEVKFKALDGTLLSFDQGILAETLSTMNIDEKFKIVSGEGGILDVGDFLTDPNQAGQQLIIPNNIFPNAETATERMPEQFVGDARAMDSTLFIAKTNDPGDSPNKNHVFNFLNISNHDIKDISEVNVGRYTPIDKSTRKRLIKFYKPHNQKLNKLLGTSFDWDN